MYKKILSLAIAITLLMSLGVNGLAIENKTDGIAIILAEVAVNGTQLDLNAEVKGGVVYLPVRSACETLGYTVEWIGTDNRETVTVVSKSKTAILDMVNQTITIDGSASSMKDANALPSCFLDNGHTYLNSEQFSAAFSVDSQYNASGSTVTITSKPEQVNISTTVGSAIPVSLKGNPTTGYAWYYTIGDSSIIEKTADNYVSDSKSASIVGTGGTYTWTFKALKAGETTVTFKYYRSWLGESSAAVVDTIVYKISVK